MWIYKALNSGPSIDSYCMGAVPKLGGSWWLVQSGVIGRVPLRVL